MNTPTTPYTTQAEALNVHGHSYFGLIYVTHQGRPHVVLHWLGYALKIPAHQIEAIARDWAAQTEGQPSPIVDLWVRGFDAAPVPCLPRAELAAFLGDRLAGHFSAAALLAALETREEAGHV